MSEQRICDSDVHNYLQVTGAYLESGTTAGFTVRSTAIVNADREPHLVANRDAIDLKAEIATINIEYISLDSLHPETESLVKA